MSGAAPGEPAPVTRVNEGGASPFVLLCEHASNHVPARYAGLGVPAAELARHIGWDIGAADLARRLSALLDAPLLLSAVSRLVIDLNRPPGAPTSIPAVSDATPVPGNAAITPEERAAREAAWFHPFHDAVAALLDRRRAEGRPTAVIGIHSFTPRLGDEERPWHAGVLFDRAEGFGRALAAAIAATGPLSAAGPPVVGENEPYRIEPGTYDHTVPVHGDSRGLDAVLIEVRQDLLADPAGIEDWALRLASALGRAAGRFPAG